MNKSFFTITLLSFVIYIPTFAADELPSYVLRNCKSGVKADCSDCQIGTSKEIKIMVNKSNNSVLIKEYKKLILENSYELEKCRIYNVKNWICNYPKNPTDIYSEDMTYKMIDGNIEFKFVSKIGVARLCGTYKN
jgi:hypothetical protein